MQMINLVSLTDSENKKKGNWSALKMDGNRDHPYNENQPACRTFQKEPTQSPLQNSGISTC